MEVNFFLSQFWLFSASIKSNSYKVQFWGEKKDWYVLRFASLCITILTKRHCTLSPKFSYALFSFFPYSPSFPIKMLATDAKTQKIEPDPNFLWRMKFSDAVCNVIDTTWGRIYFLTSENFRRKFRTQCAITFTVIKVTKTVLQDINSQFWDKVRIASLYHAILTL